MRKADWAKASQEERDNYICTFVSERQGHSERETKEDRDRWVTAHMMFAGKPPVTTERSQNRWMSSPAMPEFTATVRRSAAALQDLIFERADFFNLEAGHLGDEELARIIEKIIRCYLHKVDFENSTYEYLLIGNTYGIAVRKLCVQPELEWRPEIVVQRVDDQEAKDRKGLGKMASAPTPAELTGDPEELEGRIVSAFDALFGEGESSGPKYTRTLQPKKRLTFKIALEFPNLFNFFFDPDAKDINKSPYYIERHYLHYHQLLPSADANVIDKKKLESLKGSQFNSMDAAGVNINSSYTGQKMNLRDQMTETTSTLPLVELLEYYGPLLDCDGDIIEENRVYLVGNRKVLLRDAANGYFSQKAPYHAAVFSRIPFKAIGQGVADSSIELNLLINDLFGLWVDLMKLAVYSPKTFDASKLTDPRQVEGYIKPGQLIDTMASADESVFKDIPFNVNGVGGPLFQTIEALRLSADKGSGVDTNSANPASRARISAAEISSNVNRASQSFLALGREIDANYIIPTVQTLFEYVLQFGFEDDVLSDLVTDGILTQSEFELIRRIPRVERYNEIRRGYKIKIKGFRERLERDEFLAKTNELLSVMTRIPPNVVNVQWSALLKQYLEALNFDTDAILPANTPQDKAREENAILSRPGNQQVSIGDQDDHTAELPVHYEEALKSPVPALLQHIMGHIQASGGNIPPPPPQLAQMLGLNEPAPEPAPNGQASGMLQNMGAPNVVQ